MADESWAANVRRFEPLYRGRFLTRTSSSTGPPRCWRPTPQEQKGADRGIDGLVYFVDGPRRTPHKSVIQVRGGRVSPSQIRDLQGCGGAGEGGVGVVHHAGGTYTGDAYRGGQHWLLPFRHLGPGLPQDPDTDGRGTSGGQPVRDTVSSPYVPGRPSDAALRRTASKTRRSLAPLIPRFVLDSSDGP